MIITSLNSSSSSGGPEVMNKLDRIETLITATNQGFNVIEGNEYTTSIPIPASSKSTIIEDDVQTYTFDLGSISFISNAKGVSNLYIPSFTLTGVVVAYSVSGLGTKYYMPTMKAKATCGARSYDIFTQSAQLVSGKGTYDYNLTVPAYNVTMPLVVGSTYTMKFSFTISNDSGALQAALRTGTYSVNMASINCALKYNYGTLESDIINIL